MHRMLAQNGPRHGGVPLTLYLYIATVHPMKVKHLCSRKKVLTLIALIWSVVLVCELPYYVLWYAYDVPKPPVTYVVYNETMIPIYEITYSLYNGSVVPVYHTTMTAIPGILACINESWTHPLWKVFKWTEFALSYVLPIALSVVLYTKICRVLWARNQFLHKDTISTNKPSSTTEENGVVTKEKSAEEVALASRRSVVKMLIVCVAVFFLCYTPMISLTVWTEVTGGHVPTGGPFYEFVFIITTLVQFVSAFNPFLYTLFSKTFRDRVRDIFRCGRKATKLSPATTTSRITGNGGRKTTTTSVMSNTGV